MIIRHLPYFAVVAEEEHVHRAAIRLNMTQSALSRRIQDLEAELGVELFERRDRNVRLTQAGRVLWEDVRRILAEVDRAVRRTQAAMRGEVGGLRIALNEGAARSRVVIETLSIFRRRYPEVKVELYSLLTDEQVKLLDREEIDVGFLYEFQSAAQLELETKELFVEFLVLAMHKDHALASKPAIVLKDLAGEDWIWPSRAHGARLYDRMLAACQAGGLSPKITMEVVTAETALHMASTGLGIGFVTRTPTMPADVVLRAVDDFEVPLSLRMVWRRGDVPPSLHHLIEIVSSLLSSGKPVTQ